MRRIAIVLALVVATAAVPLAGQSAFANDRPGQRGGDAQLVVVQTTEPSGTRIVVYNRGDDGRLTPAGAYATGGNGGTATPGTESDHLASQGSLVYDDRQDLLSCGAHRAQ